MRLEIRAPYAQVFPSKMTSQRTPQSIDTRAELAELVKRRAEIAVSRDNTIKRQHFDEYY